MVSGFICPCHGLFSYETIYPGPNNYWTGARFINQLVGGNGKEGVISIAEYLHPGCELMFYLDNAPGHRIKAPDGLDASLFAKKDGGANFPDAMRDTSFIVPGTTIVRHQTFYYFDERLNKRVNKGLTTVLQERGLWQEGMKKDEAAQLLSKQPDFRAQDEWVAETIKQRGHSIDFFPKFHPELSAIERLWAFAKFRLRKMCKNSFTELEKNLPIVLDSVPPQFFLRVFRSCSRYILAYADKSLTPEQIRIQHRLYASHRRIGINAEEIAAAEAANS